MTDPTQAEVPAGKLCDFYLGDCQRCGRRAERDNQQEPCARPFGPFSSSTSAQGAGEAGGVEGCFDYQGALFDVLEALKVRHPRIAFGFARGTGGVDLPYILSEVAAVSTPPAPASGRG